MTIARARHGSHIFQRPGSPNWYIKLRSAGGKRLEKSLRTSDKLEAEGLAATLIGDHKAALLAARPRLEWVPHTLTPGEKVGPNGERVIATEREIIYLDATTGALLRTEPNGPAQRFVNLPMGAVIVGDNPTPPLAELRRMGPVVNLDRLQRATPRTATMQSCKPTSITAKSPAMTGVRRRRFGRCTKAWSTSRLRMPHEKMAACWSSTSRMRAISERLS